MGYLSSGATSGGYPIIKIKTIGPWRRELRRMRLLAPDIYASALWGQQKAAKKLVKIVKNHIIKQDLRDWAPNAPSTRRNKDDWRVLVDSETYLTNIKAYRKGFVYYAGVKKGVTEPNGIETARVAAMHEFKSYAVKGGPRRPLWGPSIRELGGAQGVRNIVRAAILAKLIKRGWSITSFNLG